MCAISGYVRGDVSVLDSLNRTGHPLLLRLDNGVRLPIVLTEKRSDGAWEFTSTVESSLDLVSRLPRRV